MIIDFNDQATSDIFNGINSKQARKIPIEIWKICRRKLDMINAAMNLNDLMVPPGNRLEPLKGLLKGCHSIRINDQYRVVFEFNNNGAKNVQITDYH